ncbi:hypothetical protein GCM10017779_45570 [Streptomyces capillispiralis]|nr:hypothetical protein GCM10017779_45570 [Streptomyces capillispiralis]
MFDPTFVVAVGTAAKAHAAQAGTAFFRVMFAIGVVVFPPGLPAMVHSPEEGSRLELRAVVVGFTVMRTAMVPRGWRAARESPPMPVPADRWPPVGAVFPCRPYGGKGPRRRSFTAPRRP